MMALSPALQALRDRCEQAGIRAVDLADSAHVIDLTWDERADYDEGGEADF